MRVKFALLVVSCLISPGCLTADKVTVKASGDNLRVEIDGELFTEYVPEGNYKPILYPIHGPDGTRMVRHFPMKPAVKGEASDHPHHRSLWFTHGAVNGVKFWHEGEGRGTQIHDALLETESGERGSIKTRTNWVDAEGKTVLTDTRTMIFQEINGAWAIDFKIKIHASAGDLTFTDTKEGTMGIRTHPDLRIKNDPKKGVTTANGKAINSEGDRDREVWGKRAKWVGYWGDVDGKTVGLAIFDHPSNPRHPTWWHARDYGLIAANAFGIHNFEKKPAGTGDMKIPAGESRTFKYRFLFHTGDTESAGIDAQYEAFAKD